MTHFPLTSTGKALLLKAVGGKNAAARVIDDAAYAVIEGAPARDRIENLFSTPGFEAFLAAWPRKSSVLFDVVVRSLFSRAAKAADTRTAERMCELLASRVFHQGIGRFVKGQQDFARLADFIVDLLDLAGAGTSLSLDFINLATSGVLETLREEYCSDDPDIYEYFKDWIKRAISLGAGPAATRELAEFLVSEDLKKLSRFALGKREALAPMFSTLLGQWIEGGAKRKSVELKLRLMRRIASSAKIEGMRRKDSRLGLALAFAELFGSIDPSFDEPLSCFADIFAFNKKAEGPTIWERLQARPDLYAKEMVFFSSKEWFRFSDYVRMACGATAVTLFLEYFFASVEEGRIEGLAPEALRVLPSLILVNRDLLRDKAFWKNRAKFLSLAIGRCSSFRIRRLLLRTFADEIILIAQGAFDIDEGRMKVRYKAEGFSALLAAKLDEVPMRPEPKEKADARFDEVFKAAVIAIWADVRQRLGKERIEGFLALFSLARSLDLDDYALEELEAIADRNLDAYLRPLVNLSRRLAGMDFIEARESAAERMDRTFWYRLDFSAAYPYIIELVLPVTGAMAILPDEEQNLARTDGSTIWLPRFMSAFEEDPERLPDNRNLTIYAGMALHEAAHIVAGSFAVDWQPFLLSFDRPVLIHSIFNAVEDFRVERYLCHITRHPQVQDIITAINIFLYAKPAGQHLFDFLMTAYARAAGHWETLVSLNPDHAVAYDELLAAGYPSGRHGSVEALGDWLADQLADMDPCDPAAAMRLASELYDSLQLWPLPETVGDPRRRRRGVPLAGAENVLATRSVMSQEELEALAEAFEEDPEGCLRGLGIDARNLAAAMEGRARSKAQPLRGGGKGGKGGKAGTKGEGPAKGEHTASDEEQAFDRLNLAFENAPDSNMEEARALERIIEGIKRACVMAGYQEQGEVKPADYGRKDREEAERQKTGVDAKKAKALGAAGSKRKRDQRRRGRRVGRPRSRIVKSSRAAGNDSLLRVCQEQPITKISRDFLAVNSQYNGLGSKIGRMLTRMIQDSSDTKSEFSSTDGDIDDERLIEMLSDPLRHDSDIFEFVEEERKTMAVVIGLDISGSTESPVAGDAKNRPTVIDVEKHFALIFMRAVRLLTDDVTVLAFNSSSGTTIYRPDPPEALSSLTPGAANRDGDFVRYCTAELSEKSKDTRYLFLISDGLPSAVGYNGQSALDDTILSLREARKAGVRIVYLNIDSGAMEYFDRFADEVVYARRFRHPEDLIHAAPALVRSLAQEVL